jgi:ribosomal protein S18 acetylase RimI-like enzyme
MRKKQSLVYDLLIRHGLPSDVDSINRIARQYPNELSYIPKKQIIKHISDGECLIADLSGITVGFVLYHHRRDGWNVIYDIAVDKEYSSRGIGKRLLFSTPTPLRLKVTSDNERAIRFYESCGMYCIEEEIGRNRPLRVYVRRLLTILCMGNHRRYPKVAAQSHMAYGSRHDHAVYEQPYMMDIHWQNYDWVDYLDKVKRYKPIMAMTPDFESIEQLPTLLEQIEDLRKLNVLRIGVCVKFDGAVQYIPEDCIVCVSVPSKYAGFLTEQLKVDLKGRNVHLLGGTPFKQEKLIKELNWYGASVISVDGNAHSREAAFHNLFNGECWVRNQPQDEDTLMIESGNHINRILEKAMEVKICPYCSAEHKN